MEDYIKDAMEKVKREAELALWSVEKLADQENINRDWFIEMFLKEFKKLLEVKK